MNKPFVIPKTEEFDYHKTGFYSYKNKDDFNLRIQDSGVELEGIIRLNKNSIENVFEGYNGSKWVQFNAVKGDTGKKGDDFNNQYKFINLLDNNDNLNTGLVFKESIFDSTTTTKIKLRTIKTEESDYNNNQMSLKTINIKSDENNIIIKSLPQPFNWNISSLSIKEMKSSTQENVIFKCYGKIITIKLKKEARIERGQFVSLEEYNGYLVGVPFSNSNNSDNLNYNSFSNPHNIIGVALQDSFNLEEIKVCSDGITTVKYNSISSMIDDNLMDIGVVDKIGCNGLLSNNGYIFCSPIEPAIGVNYINVGKFMETKSDNNYYLFNVKL